MAEDSAIIYFFPERVINIEYGILYYKNNRVLELEEGTYDMSYILDLLYQCKKISRTILSTNKIVGMKKISTNRYDLVELE